MAIVLNGTTGITAPDIDVTAQSTDIVTTGDVSAVDGTFSGGVYLGGTGAANYLDDYEEGTFTLSLSTIFDGSPNFTNTIPGRYTKIGNIVYCEFSVDLNGTNSIVVDDRWQLSGLPFSARGSQYAQGMASIHSTYGGGNSSHWNMRADTSSSILVWCFHEDGAVTYNNIINGSITYEVA